MAVAAQAGVDIRKDVYQVDDQGILYILRDTDTSLRRWSLAELEPLEPLPLGPDPLSFTWSQANGLLYVQYLDGSVTSMDPANAGVEEAFAEVSRPCGLVAAGELLVVCSIAPRSFEFHLLVFDSQGELLEEQTSAEGYEYGWSSSRRRIYFGNAEACFVEMDPAGALSAPLCSDFYGILGIVRFAPDGSRVMLPAANGVVLDGDSLEPIGSLEPYSHHLQDPVDVLFGDGALLGAHPGVWGTDLVVWGEDFAPVARSFRPGLPLRLLEWNGASYLVVSAGGEPYVWRIDGGPPAALRVQLSGREKLSFAGLGVARVPGEALIVISEDGKFTACDGSVCLAGEAVQDKERRFLLRPDAGSLEETRATLERLVGEVLSDALDDAGTADLSLDPRSLHFVLHLDASRTRAKLRLRVGYRAKLEGMRLRRVRGAFVWKLEGTASAP